MSRGRCLRVERWVGRRRPRRVVVIAAGKSLRDVEHRGYASDEGLQWNAAIARILGELLGPENIVVEATVTVHIDDETRQPPCEVHDVDVAAKALCQGDPALVLLEVKWLRRWRSLVLQAEHGGAREKRQSSRRALESLASCLDAPPSQLEDFGVYGHLIVVIGESVSPSVRDPLGYIEALTAYPRRWVSIVDGARGPSQAYAKLREALRSILKSHSCIRP